MVTYSLWCVCGCRTATSITKPHGGLTVFMQAVRLPHGFYLTARSLQALRFLNLTLNFFQKPQRRKHASSASQCHRTVAVKWHTVFLLSLVPRKSYGGLTASLRRPHGALTAPLRRPYGELVVAATTVRVLYGRLPVSLRLPHGCWSHESYDRRKGTVTFVTTATAARKTLWFLQITCTNRRLQGVMPANIKESIKAPHHGPLLRGIQQWPVDSSHKVW